MTPEQIAEGLTEAQRECLLSAKVLEPLQNVTVGGKPFMPDYYSVEVTAGHSNNSPGELEKIGLWNLPIRIGDRSWTGGYRGEILPLGRELRRILQSKERTDAG